MDNPTSRAVACWDAVARLVAEGVARPPTPVKAFGLAELEKAFRFMQAGKHTGKIIIRFDGDDDDVVPAIPRPADVTMRPDATYVVAGLGGVCREVGRWLVERGARHLLLLSRSAATGPANIAYSARLRADYGIHVLAYDCNIADRKALESVLEQCAESLAQAPIRGCVTGAMVLDVIFLSLSSDFT